MISSVNPPASRLPLPLLAAQGVRADEKPTESKVETKDKLRVAIVGVKGRGMSHVSGFLEQKDCVITTICDADKGVIGKAMETVEKKSGKAPKFEQDIRKVVEDKNIDIISIATPNHWHALDGHLGHSRMARTCTSRSPSATTSARAAASSRRRASTTRSARPAPRAAACTGLQRSDGVPARSGKLGKIKIAKRPLL